MTKALLPAFFFLLLLATVPTYASATGVEEFAADTELATSGFFRLTWGLADGQSVELEEASSDAFLNARLRYRGTDQAYFVSGKPDGTYYYRIRLLSDGDPSWVGPVSVEVRHHPLWRAWTFFGLGAFIFVATVWLVLRRPGVDR